MCATSNRIAVALNHYGDAFRVSRYSTIKSAEWCFLSCANSASDAGDNTTPNASFGHTAPSARSPVHKINRRLPTYITALVKKAIGECGVIVQFCLRLALRLTKVHVTNRAVNHGTKVCLWTIQSRRTPTIKGDSDDASSHQQSPAAIPGLGVNAAIGTFGAMYSIPLIISVPR